MNPSRKLLVVEDDPSISRVLKIIFKNINFEVYTSENGQQVCKMIQELRPDVIILDIGLPDTNGMDLIQLIREQYQIPIIMLSGRNTDVEKITCLSLGADDYVVKPFSSGELVARVHALLRRSHRYPEDQNSETLFTIRIIPEEYRAFIGEQELSLTSKEFQLLQLFLHMREKVLSRDMILDHIWGISNFEVESRAVDACVSRLRKKIKSIIGKDVIEAIPGTGYRLTIKTINKASYM